MSTKLYKSLIGDVVAPILKAYGFKSDKETFVAENQEVISLINFQKSSKTTKEKSVFTINIGFFVKSISLFRKGNVISKPEIDDCHWKIRVGFLLTEREDKWWELSTENDLVAVSKELKGVLNDRVVPLVKTYDSSNSLLEFWLGGKCQGITEFERMVNLSILLKQANRVDDLEATIDQLQRIPAEKPVYRTAQDHIRRLRD